jgi:hypothetical protein
MSAKLKSQRTSLGFETALFQSQSKSPLKEKPLVDDIDCEEWLKEIGFSQYTETFRTNFSSDGKLLLRRRLTTVRLQDFPKMNITNYEHQKSLMNQIAQVLKSPFNSITRRKDYFEEKQSLAATSASDPVQESKSVSEEKKEKIESKEQQQSSQSQLSQSKRDNSFKRGPASSKEEPVSAPGKEGAPVASADSKDSLDGKKERQPGGAKESKPEGGKDKDKDAPPSSSFLKREPSQHMSVQEKTAKRKEAEKRRRSFDSQIWQSIGNYRNKASDVASAAENLRNYSNYSGEASENASVGGTISVGSGGERGSGQGGGGGAGGGGPQSGGPPAMLSINRDRDREGPRSDKSNNPGDPDKGGAGGGGLGSKKGSHRRRWSFGTPDTMQEEAFTTAYQRATAYGNMAQEYDMMVSELKQLQSDILNKFRGLINCERASIYFINELTRELVLFDNDKWFRIPSGSGIPGFCAESGETLNIPDAYSDRRFNKNLDLKTGFKTRNILAKPVRRSRGSGNVVAVVEMVNKAEGADFTNDDEEFIGSCVESVADLLSDRFKELMNAGERFSGDFISSLSSSSSSSFSHSLLFFRIGNFYFGEKLFDDFRSE